MLWTRVQVCMLSGCVAAAVAAGTGKISCTDIPITVEISSVYIDGATTSVLQGDGRVYVDGQDGIKAVINECSGTHDATLNVSATRALTVLFGDALPGSAAATPAWIPGAASVGFLNVRSLKPDPAEKEVCGDPACTYKTFTTTFAANFKGPDGKSYDLRFADPCSDYPPRQSWDWVDTPFLTARIVVKHSIAPKEQWEVYPDQNQPTCALTTASAAPQASTLVLNGRTTQSNVGQFTMPFMLTIRRK